MRVQTVESGWLERWILEAFFNPAARFFARFCFLICPIVCAVVAVEAHKLPYHAAAYSVLLFPWHDTDVAIREKCRQSLLPADRGPGPRRTSKKSPLKYLIRLFAAPLANISPQSISPSQVLIPYYESHAMSRGIHSGLWSRLARRVVVCGVPNPCSRCSRTMCLASDPILARGLHTAFRSPKNALLPDICIQTGEDLRSLAETSQ